MIKYLKRKRMIFRIIAMILVVVILAGVLPEKTMTVYAAEEVFKPGFEYANYNRIESIEGKGNPRPLAYHFQGETQYKKKQYIIYSPMMVGEETVMQYSMPTNGLMNATIYRWDKMEENYFEYFAQYSDVGFIPTEEEWEHLKSTKEAKEANAGKEELTAEEKAAETCEEGSYLGYVYGCPYYGHIIRQNTQVTLKEGAENYKAVYKEIEKIFGLSVPLFREMKEYGGLGLDGEGSIWNSLSAYYRVKGLENPYAEEIVKEESVSEGNVQEDPVAEESVSQGDIMESVSGGDTIENVSEGDAKENVSEGDAIESVSQGDGMEALITLEPEPEETYSDDEQWIRSLLGIEEGDMSVNDIPKEEIPSDYYCAPGYQKKARVNDFETDYDIHNYMAWEGQYVTPEGEVRTLGDGCYLIVFEYAKDSSSYSIENTHFLPIQILSADSEYGGLSKQPGTV